MKRVYTVSGNNNVGYEFNCGCNNGAVGEEVLVFKQYGKIPYGIAIILDGTISTGFKMIITEVFA